MEPCIAALSNTPVPRRARSGRPQRRQPDDIRKKLQGEEHWLSNKHWLSNNHLKVTNHKPQPCKLESCVCVTNF